MSTAAAAIAAVNAPIPAPAAPAHHNGFVRFIDAIGHGFVKAEPVVVHVAQTAEPILALTPFGPEYTLVVNAIVGAQQHATASIAAGGAALTGADKFALSLSAATPALTVILNEKGVTADQQTAIMAWVQTVFQILAGPVAVATAGSVTP